jgi:hypothetical protein
MSNGISIASIKAFLKAPLHAIIFYFGAALLVLAGIGILRLPTGRLSGLWIGPMLVVTSIIIYSKAKSPHVTVTKKRPGDVNTVVKAVVIIAILFLLVLIGSFVCEFLFHIFPNKQFEDLQNWAWFGSYFGGTIGPVFALGNFIVTLLVFWWLNHHRFRESTAFDFYTLSSHRDSKRFL